MPFPETIVLASGNKGKLKELGEMFAPLGCKVVAQAEFFSEEAVEDGLSFLENAIIKARFASEKTGLPAIADDSGLCVHALGGEPGIYSARYAGTPSNDSANNQKLLSELNSTADRRAHFHCALALVMHSKDPAPLIAEARWQGSILNAEQGDMGFGYDPLFWIAEHNCSSAELPRELKNRISHRGQAMTILKTAVAELLA